VAVAELFGLECSAEDFFGGCPAHFVDDVEGAWSAVAVVVDGVGVDESVFGGVVGDSAEQAGGAADGGGPVAGVEKVGFPLVDVVWVDVG
jgi:hypothetical protein